MIATMAERLHFFVENNEIACLHRLDSWLDSLRMSIFGVSIAEQWRVVVTF